MAHALVLPGAFALPDNVGSRLERRQLLARRGASVPRCRACITLVGLPHRTREPEPRIKRHVPA